MACMSLCREAIAKRQNRRVTPEKAMAPTVALLTDIYYEMIVQTSEFNANYI